MESGLATLLTVSANSALQLLTAEPQAGETAISAWTAAGLTVRVARGKKSRSREGLFDEFAAALQFPWYFGENWDAFDECLSDLSWLPPAKGYVVVITDPADVLVSSDEDLEIFVRLLSDANREWATPPNAIGEAWGRPALPFHVVLQTLPIDRSKAFERWDAGGATLIPWLDGLSN